MVDNILIFCRGGRGDVFDCEPPVRFLVKEVFKEAEKIAITSEMTEPFEHLQSEQVSLHLNSHTKDNLQDFVGYNVLCSFEHDKRPVHGLNQPLMHGVDFASLHLLGYLLPEKKRKIKLLAASEEEREAVTGYFSKLGLDPCETLLLHPGNTWETRTVPVEWWEEFIKHYPYPVCVYGSNGKRVAGEDSIINGMLPLPNVPSLVDKLTIRGAMVATELCWGVMTNDSFPVHIAAGYNNYLFTFALTKHWDTLKPYGHKKSYNFGKEVFDPTWYTAVNHTFTFDKFPPGVTSIMPFLLDPKVAADAVAKKFEDL